MIKFPKILIPVFIVVLILLAVKYSGVLALPSAEYLNPGLSDIQTKKSLEWTIKGVKCRGTSEYLISRLKDTGGIISITTYASTNRCIIEYNSLKTNPKKIKNYIEAPYFNSDTGEWIDNIFVVVNPDY